MHWFEDLLNECPPKDAFEPNNLKVYRLAKEASIDEGDFQQALNYLK